jgi:PAS domain S-box-containing protein
MTDKPLGLRIPDGYNESREGDQMTLTGNRDMRLGQETGRRDGNEEEALSCRLAAECMQTLAAAALEMAELPANADLFQFVGRKVHAMIGEGIVAVNSIEGRTLTPRVLWGVRPVVMRLAQRLLGRSVVDMPIDDVHDVAKSRMLTGKLEKVEGGLYEMFFRTVPRPVCWTLEKVAGIRECYSIGLRQSNKLFGNITILRQDRTRLHAEMIEALANQASAVLERSRTIKALMQTEQRFRLLYESVQAGVVLERADGTIVHANRMAGEICGMAPEAVQFKTLADLGCRMILEDGTPVPREDYPSRITVRTGQPVRGAIRGVYLSGSPHVRWLLINTEPLRRDDDAKVEDVLVTFHDVTPFKRAQREIESSQRFLQAILSSFPGNVVVIDGAGIAVTVNDSWAAFGQMNGLDSKFFQGGWSYLEACRAAKGPGSDKAQEVADAIEAVLRGQRISFEMEYPCHSPDLQRWFHLRIQGFVYESKRWAVLSHVDITDRKKAEKALVDSGTRFWELFNNMTSGGAVYEAVEGGEDFIFKDFNKAAEKIEGVNRADVIGRRVTEVFSGVGKTGLLETFRRVWQSGRAEYCPALHYTDDRRSHWVENRVYRLPSGEIAAIYDDVTNRRKTQMALQESEERYRLLFENASDLIFVHELATRDDPKCFIAANRAAAERIGYSQEELLGLTPFDVMVGADAEEFYRETALLKQKNQLLSQRRLVAKSGEIIPVEIHARVFQYQGKPTVISMACDITERKRSEEKLRRSEAKYRMLHESMRDGFVSVDMDGRLMEFNGTFQEMLGYTAQELRRLTCRDLAPEKWHAAEVAIVDSQVLQRGYSDVYEKEYRRKDGTVFPIEMRTTLIRNGAGQPAGMWAIIRDITERKKLEREVAVRERNLNWFFTSAAVGLVLLDKDLRYLRINETLAKMNAVPVKDHLGKTVREIMPQLAPAVEPIFRKVLTTGEPVLNVEVTGARPDCPGVQRHWIESFFPVMGVGGAPEGVGAVVVEITDRKKAEQRLVARQGRLRRLTAKLALAEERERRRIGIGLHDHVGQSLVMTKFALQAVAQTADQATAAILNRICGDIDGQIERVRSLSFELSDSILYEVGFQEAVEAYLAREIQGKHGIKYQLSVEGEYSKLQNDTKIVLFRNVRELLANIVRHSRARHVDVRITAMVKKLCISIGDDGVGFNPEDTSHGDAGQAHFGLFSVAEQLRFLGGQLKIRSAPGRGTHIVMIAPL